MALRLLESPRSHRLARHHTSAEQQAADRFAANPGQKEGEVTAYKSSLSVNKDNLN